MVSHWWFLRRCAIYCGSLNPVLRIHSRVRIDAESADGALQSPREDWQVTDWKSSLKVELGLTNGLGLEPERVQSGSRLGT